MPGSDLHKHLLESIERLRVALLPAQFDPTGSYSSPDEVHLRTASFRVLVHAEIETYLEDAASGVLQLAWTAWSERGTPSRVLLGLLAFSGRSHPIPPPSVKSAVAEGDLRTAVQKAQAAWRDALRKNHGLKEENVLRLLLPLGIGAQDFDSTLLSDLSSFGSERGEVAHQSAVRVKRQLDPEEEYRRAINLAGSLLGVDNMLERAVSEVERLDSAM